MHETTTKQHSPYVQAVMDEHARNWASAAKNYALAADQQANPETARVLRCFAEDAQKKADIQARLKKAPRVRGDLGERVAYAHTLAYELHAKGKQAKLNAVCEWIFRATTFCNP